jgi:hypothetical protein
LAWVDPTGFDPVVVDPAGPVVDPGSVVTDPDPVPIDDPPTVGVVNADPLTSPATSTNADNGGDGTGPQVILDSSGRVVFVDFGEAAAGTTVITAPGMRELTPADADWWRQLRDNVLDAVPGHRMMGDAIGAYNRGQYGRAAALTVGALADSALSVFTIGGSSVGEAAAEGAAAAATRGAATIETSAVRFTQSSVSQTLRTGENINDVIGALRGPGGDALAKGFEPIRIFEQDGGLFTLDNRRLSIFSAAGRDVPFVWATPAEVTAESWKFTATAEQAGGWFIRVK